MLVKGLVYLRQQRPIQRFFPGNAKKLAGFALLILFGFPSALHAQFDFVTNNGVVVIASYTGPGGEVDIPSQTNGLPVAGLDTYAFHNRLELTSVIIPESVTNIGLGVFEDCHNLASVTIPASVMTIGEQAFYNCWSLTNVTVPRAVQTIASGAFYGCSALTSLPISSSVTNIGESAFYDCGSLPSIAIPMGVQSVGAGAFSTCLSATNVTIPSSVTSISGNAFNACSSLEAFVVDSQNPSYATQGGVLFSKDLTLLIAFPAGKAGSYSVPGGVTKIGDAAFALCQNITNLYIPGSVTNLGVGSFSHCEGLSKIAIPSSVRYIDNYAFQDCKLLREVFFLGNAPDVSGYGASLFIGDSVKLYYLPGTSGWDAFFGFLNLSGNLWNPTLSFGNSGTNEGFGLTIAGTADIPFTIEATTNLAEGVWAPVERATLTNGVVYFSELRSANYPSRFYRVCWP